MNWIQQNKTLAGILGFMIAGAIGLGVWFYLSYSEYSTAMEERNTLAGNVANLQSAKVFPSLQNVKMVEQRIKDYRDKFSTLRKVLLSPTLQQPIKPMSETEFQAKVKERAIAVKKRADAVGMKLPSSDFALGFEGYSSELPPNAAVAAELNVHLDVIEKLISVLVESGVNSLDSIKRTLLPGEKNSGKVEASPPPVLPGNKLLADSSADQVLDRYTINCVFSTDQGPLQNVINTLSNPAKMPHFLAVRLIRVENEKPEGSSKEEVRNMIKTAPAPPVDAPKKPGEVASSDGSPAPQPPDAVTIMGGEVLKVYLEIDYIRFRPAAADAAGAGTPKAPK